MEKSLHLFMDNKHHNFFTRLYTSGEHGFFSGFITQLLEGIELKETSKIALVGIKIIYPEGKPVYTSQNLMARSLEVPVTKQSFVMNVCSNLVVSSLTGDTRYPILQNIIFNPSKLMDYTFVGPIYHSLNVALLRDMEIHFTNTTGDYIHLNGDADVVCTLHLKI